MIAAPLVDTPVIEPLVDTPPTVAPTIAQAPVPTPEPEAQVVAQAPASQPEPEIVAQAPGFEVPNEVASVEDAEQAPEPEPDTLVEDVALTTPTPVVEDVAVAEPAPTVLPLEEVGAAETSPVEVAQAPDFVPTIPDTAPRLGDVAGSGDAPRAPAQVEDTVVALAPAAPEAPAPSTAIGERRDTPQGVATGVAAPDAPRLAGEINAPNAPQPTTTPAPQPKLAQAPRVIVADELGVRVIQDPGRGPSAMANVSIDTITYDDMGDVVLGGRGSAAAYVRVYLDNDPIRTTRIGEDGQWRADLPRIDTRVYTLRVDEIEENGDVISRTETPFQPAKPEEAIAAAAAPEASIQVVTVQPGFTLWRIARENYGEGQLYVRVFEANSDKIRDPDLIYPGQIFTVPE